MPEDAAGYVQALALHRYFETVAFTREDTARSRYYAENAQRKELAARATDLNSFLVSLGMTDEGRGRERAEHRTRDPARQQIQSVQSDDTTLYDGPDARDRPLCRLADAHLQPQGSAWATTA